MPYYTAPVYASAQYQQAIPDQLAQLRAAGYAGQQMQQPMTGALPSGASEDCMIWVQGEAGAKAYFVAAGCKAVLWDSESPVFYIKSADAGSGIPSMRTFDYSERSSVAAKIPAAMPSAQAVTVDEFNRLAGTVSELEARLNNIIQQQEVKNAESAI